MSLFDVTITVRVYAQTSEQAADVVWQVIESDVDAASILSVAPVEDLNRCANGCVCTTAEPDDLGSHL